MTKQRKPKQPQVWVVEQRNTASTRFKCWSAISCSLFRSTAIKHLSEWQSQHQNPNDTFRLRPYVRKP